MRCKGKACPSLPGMSLFKPDRSFPQSLVFPINKSPLKVLRFVNTILPKDNQPRRSSSEGDKLQYNFGITNGLKQVGEKAWKFMPLIF